MSNTSSSIQDDWKESITKILTKISNRRDAEDFLLPVPWSELNLLDYPEIVEKPMDLTTVLKNLSSDVYKSKEDCVVDVRLIWSNSMLYNAPGSGIYETTKKLRDIWERMWVAAQGPDSKIEDVAKPPSTEELRSWIDDCHGLSPDQLGKLLRHIDGNCPKALFKRVATNEIEVHADLLPGKFFRSLVQMTRQLLDSDSFMTSLMSNTKSRASSAPYNESAAQDSNESPLKKRRDDSFASTMPRSTGSTSIRQSM